MTMTTPLQTFWEGMMKYPFSGDVTQAISPYTNWFSPQITVNAGDPRLEARILTDGASYGRQLGVVIDALRAVVEKKQDKEAFAALTKLADKIDGIKEAHRGNLAAQAEDSLKKLWSSDPDAAKALIGSVQAWGKGT